MENCLPCPPIREVIQVQEGIACRLRESHLRRDDETLTAHTVRLATYFVNYSRCKSANSYKELTQITLVLDA